MSNLLSDKTIDNKIKLEMQNLSGNKREQFKKISEQAWFRSYARKSKEQLAKITKKVKAGIKHKKYNTSQNMILAEEEKQFEKPKIKKEKEIKKEHQKIFEKLKTTKSKTNKQKLMTAPKKYPDASYYEILHGINSKASQKYRIRHGETKEYTGRIIKKE